MPEPINWTPECTCVPGTEANGWHEKRCQSCRDLESAIWREMTDRWDA